MKLVYLEWVDSSTTNGWQPIKELAEVATAILIQSVGWLAYETDDVLVLTGHAYKDIPQNGSERHVADTMTIPRVAIRTYIEMTAPTV